MNSVCGLCRICGGEINDTKNCLSFGAQYKLHAACFRCAACKKLLTMRSYFLSAQRKFYCRFHYDTEARNVHENFLRELRTFKQISRQKIENNGQVRVNVPSVKQGFQLTIKCQCINGRLLLTNESYWIECVLEECPFFCFYRQMCERTNFEIPYWKLSTIHSDGHFHIDFFEEELFELCFVDDKHSNYYAIDERIGPVILSVKHEFVAGKSCYRILLRSSSHIIEGIIPLSCLCVQKYAEPPVIEMVSRELHLSSTLKPFVDPLPPPKLKGLDKVMLKDELKVGLLYIKKGQLREDEFFTNVDHSKEFDQFLDFLGDRVRLLGFQGYSGGLDTKQSLTGECSVYKEWKNYRVMFHVTTMLPMNEHDDMKLQRKRHVGNDIVCVVYLEEGAQFEPGSIRSNFLHLFIVVQPQKVDGVLHYKVSVASRNTVSPFGPPLPSSQLFKPDSYFNDWLFAKIINGERASYRSFKFFTMQERTRRQLLEEIIQEQMSKDTSKSNAKSPFQRLWSSRTSRLTQSSSSLCSMSCSSNNSSTSVLHKSWSSGHFPDWLRKKDDSSQLERDFKRAFSTGVNQYHDIFFSCGGEEESILPGVRAILAARSRVFHEMLYGNELLRRQSLSYPPPGTPSPSRKRWSELWRRAASSAAGSPVLSMKKSNKELYVTDFEVDEFRALLEFIHTGSCYVHKDILTGLACAAEHYEIEQLVQLCIDCCADIINPYNACLMLVSGRRYTQTSNIAKIIEEKILDFISLHMEKVVEVFDCASLSKDCFLVILSTDLKIDPRKKFNMVTSWYKRLTALVGGEDSKLKDLLFSHVDFSQFNHEENNRVNN